MDDKVKVWLYDMLNAIVEIDSFFDEYLDFEIYKKDTKTKRAVERNIEIIGEAMNRILQVEPEIQLSSKRQMVDTRNRIIHGYDSRRNPSEKRGIGGHLSQRGKNKRTIC